MLSKRPIVTLGDRKRAGEMSLLPNREKGKVSKEFGIDRGFTSIRKVFDSTKLLVLWLANVNCVIFIVVYERTICVNVIALHDEQTNQICIT